MKKILFLLCCSQLTFAMNMELGLSFAKKKNSFDQDNYFDTESTTGSVSLYFSESIALELSYTDAKASRHEKPSGGNGTETFQKTEVLGADLIYVLADKKDWIQPYIKGGAAQLKRKQIVYNETTNQVIDDLDIETAVVPSYGAGLKFLITQGLSFRLSYDVWKTPVGGGVTSDDSQIRAGISWML